MTGRQWQHFRELVAIIAGTALLVTGILQEEPAMLTIGAGLVGFSPAAKGPANGE